MAKKKPDYSTSPDWDDRATMFYVPAIGVEPNTKFMEWVAAEYEAEYAFNAIEEHGPKYVAASERATMNAWNRMMDRTPKE